jgi:regulator of protease activity HflC (stomatin/prohibitin superfamily)
LINALTQDPFSGLVVLISKVDYMPALIVLVFLLLLSGLRIVQQYQKGVVFRFGKVIGVKEPGLTWVVPLIDQVKKVDMRTITLPIPPQKIITRDNVSVDVSAVAYYKITDAVKKHCRNSECTKRYKPNFPNLCAQYCG